MDLLESARQTIRAAMDHSLPLQERVASTGKTENPMFNLIEKAQQLLAAGEYEKVIDIQANQGEPGDTELANLIGWAHVMQGNALADLAETKTGAEADRLLIQAGETYAAALEIKPDLHDALLNWGNALAMQASTKTEAEADRLWTLAGEKYAAALAIKPDKHDAFYNWGNALADQARTRTGAEADRLFSQAGERYAAALEIKPDLHDALFFWGSAIAAQAGTNTGAEADRLWTLAGEKYAAALAIKPDMHEAYNAWTEALLIQAEGKSETEVEDLFRQAQEYASKAESLVPGVGAYNLACVEARRGNEDDCRAWLIKSKESGTLPSRNHLLQDSDLSSVRQRDWFQSFLD